MLGSPHYYEVLITEGHLDTFGHVNNARYLDILEQARWDLITQHGFGLRQIQQSGVGPTVLEINLRFLRELRNRERIKITSYTDSYSGKVGKFVQQIHNEAGELCCDALFVIGLFDVRARKLILPTPEWLRAIGVSEGSST
jgi:acyl-CoA thioester hydrolase